MDSLRSEPPTWAWSAEATPATSTGGVRLEFPERPTSAAPLGRLHHYDILEYLGSGASGLVFRARDTRLDRIVAIKVLRGDLATTANARDRLLREARTPTQCGETTARTPTEILLACS